MGGLDGLRKQVDLSKHSQLSSQLPFSGIPHLDIYLMLPSWVTVITTFSWQEHLYRTVPLCIAELLWIYISTGYYIRIDIAHDPDPLVTIFNWLFWLIGSEFAEL